MIWQTKIKDADGNGEYTIFQTPDIEYVDPIEHYSNNYLISISSMMRDLLLLNKHQFPLEIMEKVIQKQALSEWDKIYEEINQTKLPNNLLSVLTSKAKNEQVKLLKNLSITPNQLIAFIFKARVEHGYLFSQYSAEHHHNGLDVSQLPKLIDINDDKVHKIGTTTLTDGQLKQTIEHRKVVVSKFLDKGNEWHCFFLTFDSLKGKEKWKNGQPHYHYISDKFGHSREYVVNELKSREYKLGNLPHIDLMGYRINK